MADELQGLLERINREGIQKTEEETKNLLDKANSDAAKLIEEAKAQAASIVAEAKAEAVKERDKTNAAIKQASRDLLIALRKTVEAELRNVVNAVVQNSLDEQTLSTMIEAMVKGFADKGMTDSAVEVLLSKEDAEKLEKSVNGLLKDQIAKGLTLTPAAGVSAGIKIGLEGNDAKFDITDDTLTELICAYISPKLSALIKE